MNDGTENIMDLEEQNSNFPTTELETVTIRFAGDSGDGMQLTGNQFTQSSVMIGNDVITFPDFLLKSALLQEHWQGFQDLN